MEAAMAIKRVHQMVTLDTILTGIVTVLFLYFTWSSNRWVEGLESRTNVIEKEQTVAAVERTALKTELSLSYREVMRRLDEISKDVKDIKRESR